MFQVTLFLHVVFAAVIIGVTMGITRNARAAMQIGVDAFRLAAEDAKKRGIIASGCGVGILLTGVGLLLQKGGFANISPSYHIALTLGVVAMLVGLFMLKPAAEKLVAAGEGDAVDTEAATAAIKRFAMGAGINHLLWMIMLAMMIWPFGTPPSAP